MSHAGFVIGAWAVTLVAIGAYVMSLLSRGRRLMRRARRHSSDGDA